MPLAMEDVNVNDVVYVKVKVKTSSPADPAPADYVEVENLDDIPGVAKYCVATDVENLDTLAFEAPVAIESVVDDDTMYVKAKVVAKLPAPAAQTDYVQLEGLNTLPGVGSFTIVTAIANLEAVPT